MDVLSSSGDAAASYPEGSVAWVQLTGYYPWWPHKVVKEDGETIFTAFGDDSSCDGLTRKVCLYNCEQVEEMISKGKAKLRKRPDTLAQYCAAIEEAEKYIQDNLDPSYSFPTTTTMTPLSALLHSDVYTLGSDSASSSSQRESPRGKPRRKVSSVSRKRRNAGGLPKVNGENGGSESEDATPIRKKLKMDGKGEGEGRRGNEGKSQPRKLVKTTGNVDPLLATVSLKKTTKKQLTKANEGSSLVDSKMQLDPLTAEVVMEPGVGGGGAKAAAYRPRKSGSGISGKWKGRNEANTATTETRRSCSVDGGDSHVVTLRPRDTTNSPLQQTTPTDTPTPSTAPSIEITTPAVTMQATPTAPPTVEAVHIPPPTVPAELRPSPFSSDSENNLEQDSRSSDDDELPSVDVKGDDEEKIKIHQLNEKDVVWVKYGKYPFWPALISSVRTPKKRKHKASTGVYFFGYSDDKTISIHDSRKIAPFKQQDEFMAAGSTHKHFEQAVKEAHDFIQDSAEREFSGCTPKEIMKQFESLRPKELQQGGVEEIRLLSPQSTSEEEEGEGDESISSSNEHSEHEEETMDDNCNDSFPYTYDRVVKEIETMKHVLEEVAEGKVDSSFHSIYTSGSKRQKENLKLISRGPIEKWPSTKVNQLLEEVLMGIAGRQRGIRYTLDVLLPEAMVRVKAEVENISFEQALAEM